MPPSFFFVAATAALAAVAANALGHGEERLVKNGTCNTNTDCSGQAEHASMQCVTDPLKKKASYCAIKYEGYAVDVACVERDESKSFDKGVSVLLKPWEHTKACLMMPQCIKELVLLEVVQMGNEPVNWIKYGLTAELLANVAGQIKASPEAAGIRVKVEGCLTGATTNVTAGVSARMRTSGLPANTQSVPVLGKCAVPKKAEAPAKKAPKSPSPSPPPSKSACKTASAKDTLQEQLNQQQDTCKAIGKLFAGMASCSAHTTKTACKTTECDWTDKCEINTSGMVKKTKYAFTSCKKVSVDAAIEKFKAHCKKATTKAACGAGCQWETSVGSDSSGVEKKQSECKVALVAAIKKIGCGGTVMNEAIAFAKRQDGDKAAKMKAKKDTAVKQLAACKKRLAGGGSNSTDKDKKAKDYGPGGKNGTATGKGVGSVPKAPVGKKATIAPPTSKGAVAPVNKTTTKVCCKSRTLECLACMSGMTELQYCDYGGGSHRNDPCVCSGAGLCWRDTPAPTTANATNGTRVRRNNVTVAVGKKAPANCDKETKNVEITTEVAEEADAVMKVSNAVPTEAPDGSGTTDAVPAAAVVAQAASLITALLAATAAAMA